VRLVACPLAVALAISSGVSAAQEEEKPLRAEDVHLEGSTQAQTILPEAPPEAPPPLPRHKGFVLEGSLGALGFLGQFRHVAPTAPLLRVQLGYEFFRWLMAFAEGELAFSDTSVSQDPSKSRAFPIYGFGAGARFTVHATERVAIYAQGSVGALKADVPQNSFGILGYRDAESLGVSFGARLGVEWYQIDRHMALGLVGGIRDATGFAKVARKSDTALMWDGSAVIRYTF
jgi:hypothetical protein